MASGFKLNLHNKTDPINRKSYTFLKDGGSDDTAFGLIYGFITEMGLDGEFF